MPRIVLIYNVVRWHSLFSSYRPLSEPSGVRGQGKAFSGFLPLSVLRSVPELHHNDRGFNRGRTLVGSHKDLAEKPKYLTKALDRHCPGESFVFADDRFLFSNMDMQHIQHYTHCSLLRKTPSGRPRSVCTLSHG